VGVSGCVGGRQNQENCEISATERIESERYDATLSTLGYMKFVEKPQDNVVEVRQTIIDVSLECSAYRLAVSSGEENNKITVNTEMRENTPDVVCEKEFPSETGVKIKFTELNKGCEIEFVYNDLSIVYVTTGDSNTKIVEPYEVPDGIRI